jgi:hypothetical protein
MNTEQLISNGERFKPAFAERDKKQTMIFVKGILIRPMMSSNATSTNS